MPLKHTLCVKTAPFAKMANVYPVNGIFMGATKRKGLGNLDEMRSALATLEGQGGDAVLSLKRELHVREIELNAQQRLFAKAMATGECNQTQAAKKAGYSERSACLQGYRLMANDKVLAVIELYEKLDALLHGFPKHKKRHEAYKILTGPKTRDADKLAALNYLSRLDGDFEEGAGGNTQIVVSIDMGGNAGRVIDHDAAQLEHDHSFKGGRARNVPTGLLED